MVNSAIPKSDSNGSHTRSKCLNQLFEEQSALEPDAVALIFGSERVTYRELNERANRLAHLLKKRGVESEVVVGISVQRSVELIVGLLAILKAGGAYLPLDKTYPTERLALMLNEARASLVILQSPESVELPTGTTGLVLDHEKESIAGESTQNCITRCTAENLAYVMYTSGSTGRPKGVMVDHRSIIRLVKEVNYATLGPEETFFQYAPISFDASTFEIWGSLISGAKLVIPGDRLSLEQLGDEIKRQGVTTLWLTAGLFHQMVDTQLESLAGVRQLLAGGDVLSVTHVEKLTQQLPDCQLINGYGPTENTTFTCCYRVKPGERFNGSVPIGEPISQTQIYLLNCDMEPVEPGALGELYVGGKGLARGYLNDPQLTAEKFLPNPFGDPGTQLYRTGDQARYLPTGDVEFLGRLDQQVKIRGYRIELGEIEHVLGQHPSVAECVVVAREDQVGEKQLVAYIVPAAENAARPFTSKLADSPWRDIISRPVPDVANWPVSRDSATFLIPALREHLKQELPEYMIPGRYVFLETLPLSVNGKLDRKGLPPPERARPELEQEFEAPRNEIEELLAAIWTEILGIDQVGIHDNFFELGGHSLLATQAIYRIRERCEKNLPLQTFFKAPTVAELAAALPTAGKSAGGAIPRQGLQSAPLSFGQQRLWFLNQLIPGTPVHNIPAAIPLTKAPNVAALEQSLNEIVRRHESLRTTIASADGKPIQVIAPELSIALPVIELSDLPVYGRNDEARRIATAEAHRPFDLFSGPLFRAHLIRLSPREHVLLLTMHHIISDGWSLGILLRELGLLYEAFASGNASPLAPLPIQYSDFALWQKESKQEEEVQRQLSYWKQQLAGAPQVIELPADRPRPNVQTFDGARETITLSASLANELRAFSRREGATLFMTLLAAFNVLLHRYTGQEDIVVGSPIANRPRTEVEELIGFFLNNLVLRTRLTGQDCFYEVLDHVRQAAVGAYANQAVPFERLVEELQPARDVRRTPIFQVFFNLLKFADDQISLPGLTQETISAAGVWSQSDEAWSQFDLTLYARERSAEIDLILVYSSDLFEPATIARMLRQFQVLLGAAIAQPEKPVGALSLLTDAERAALIDDFNEDIDMYEVEQEAIDSDDRVGVE